MSRIIKCDRCGEEITTKDRIGYVCVLQKNESGETLAEKNPFDSYDFCQGCVKEIVEFASVKKMVKRRGTARPKTGASAGTSVKQKAPSKTGTSTRGRRAKKVADPNIDSESGMDAGKIFALAQAGWSVDKIADEMRCDAGDITNVLARSNDKEIIS